MRYNGDMKMYFSNQGQLRYFASFVERLDFDDSRELKISMDERWVNVHPAHLVLAAALAKKVGKEYAEIVSRVPTSARYLDRMGLYKLLKTPSPFGEYEHREASGRFIPITFVRDATEQSCLIADMVPLLHLNENDARIIKYVVGELVRNVLEHSLAEDGAVVAAQYFKQSNQISLAICDTGIGLKQGLRIWRPKDDETAVREALTPGVSGASLSGGGSDNAGAGLFFVKSIAKTTRNNFMIYSGNTVYVLKKNRADQKKIVLHADPFEDACVLRTDMPSLGGTLVAVNISLDESVEFRQILDQIGQAYSVAMDEQRRRRYRKPNFI